MRAPRSGARIRSIRICDASTGRLRREEPAPNHPCVVDDDEVAGNEVFGNLGERPVRDIRRCRIEDQQAGCRGAAELDTAQSAPPAARNRNRTRARCAMVAERGPKPPRRRRLLTYTPAPAAQPCPMRSVPYRGRDGGTGRRAGLKIQYWETVCEFESRSRAPNPDSTRSLEVAAGAKKPVQGETAAAALSLQTNPGSVSRAGSRLGELSRQRLAIAGQP